MTAKAKFRFEGEDATEAAFRSILGNAQSTSHKIGRFFETAFVGLSIAGVAEMGLHFVELGDHLNKAAVKAGITGRAMSELAYAGKLADVELSQLSTGIKKMQVNLSEAASGGKAQIQTLAALGLTIKDLKGLDPDKQFEILADQIHKLQDPADRARAAVEQFGKAGADLLPMFEQGAEGLRKAREEAKRLGDSFSDEQLKKLAEADDAIKRLKASWEGFATAITAKAAPALSHFLDLLHGDVKVAGLTGTMGKGDILEDMKRQINSLSVGPIDKIHQDMIDDLTERMRRIDAGGGRGGPGRFGPVVKGFENPADKAAEAKRLKAIQDQAFADYIDGVRAKMKVDEEWEQLAKEGIQKVGSDYSQALSNVETMVGANLEEISDNFKEMNAYADEAARNMQDAFADFLFDPFKDGLKGMLKGFVDIIRRMLAEEAAAGIFSSLKAAGGGSVLGGLFSGIKSLFGFADGGSFRVGGAGGTDSQLVAFKASPDETVSITKPGQRAGGGGAPVINLSIVQNNPTTDAMAMLPAMAQSIIQQAVQLSRAQFREDVRSGALR